MFYKNHFIKILIFLLSINLSIPSPVLAGDFDGSKRLYGRVTRVVEVNTYQVIDNVDPDTVGLPRYFHIDFKNRMLLPTRDSLVRRTSKIKNIEHIEHKLILQGTDEGVDSVDDGLGWSLAISKKTGRITGAASGDGVAYVVFGVCRPAEKD